MTNSIVAALMILTALRSAPGSRSALELSGSTGLPHDETMTALWASERAGLVAKCPDSRRGYPGRYRLTEAGMW
ncbi:hypothetical protein [Rhodococcus sp. PvP104]|uniref:hypothetical protein n=1 Tax=Rhodococcus sp. PvP104 TaxID=2817911 RepID=UPI001AE97B5D|nr:hypothetical protein [Rhodococcus sp. PvP104]MBP2523715.1 DNA-binding IclR family transcriptional regulator [Rhodococcus sp. PvP104]